MKTGSDGEPRVVPVGREPVLHLSVHGQVRGKAGDELGHPRAGRRGPRCPPRSARSSVSTRTPLACSSKERTVSSRRSVAPSRTASSSWAATHASARRYPAVGSKYATSSVTWNTPKRRRTSCGLEHLVVDPVRLGERDRGGREVLDAVLPGGRRTPHDQSTAGDEQALPGGRLELAPQLMGSADQRDVLGALADGEPRDARLAVRGAQGVGRGEPVDPDDARAGPCELVGRRAADRPEADHDDVAADGHAPHATRGRAPRAEDRSAGARTARRRASPARRRRASPDPDLGHRGRGVARGSRVGPAKLRPVPVGDAEEPGHLLVEGPAHLVAHARLAAAGALDGVAVHDDRSGRSMTDGRTNG